jgi:hypothetical protein
MSGSWSKAILFISCSCTGLFAQQPPQQPPDRKTPGAARISVDKRYALVIGNAVYRGEMPLKNPPNDCADIREQLEKLDFEVTVGSDLNRDEMEKEIREFASRLGSSDLALFYFAGHGIQFKQENYLLPVDYDSGSDVTTHAVPLSSVRGSLEQAGAKVRVLVLDPVRNNPAGKPNRTPGLGVFPGGQGTIVAYSTKEGEVAYDRPDERNGLYATYLLAALKTPGLTLRQVLTSAKDDVYTLDGRHQSPYLADDLIGDVDLVTGVPVKTAAAHNLTKGGTVPGTPSWKFRGFGLEEHAKAGPVRIAETTPEEFGSNSRYISWLFHVDVDKGSPGSLPLTCVFLDQSNHEVSRLAAKLEIKKFDSKGHYVSRGWGDEGGKAWRPGHYSVRCEINGSPVIQTSFSVMENPVFFLSRYPEAKSQDWNFGRLVLSYDGIRWYDQFASKWPFHPTGTPKDSSRTALFHWDCSEFSVAGLTTATVGGKNSDIITLIHGQDKPARKFVTEAGEGQRVVDGIRHACGAS